MLTKQTLWCALPVLLAASAATLAPWPAHPEGAKPSCENLVAAARKEPAKADFTALRLTCAADPAHHDSDRDLRAKMRAALAKDDWPAVIDLGNRLLAGNYLDIDAHMFVAFAHEKLNQADKAAPHRAAGDGLMSSILASGNGRSLPTAFVVISVDEEYSVLRHYRLVPGEQALLHANGHSYDKLTAGMHDSQEKATVYFNIDQPMARLDAELSGH